MLLLLAEENAPNLFRVLGPLVALIGIAVFGWISEKIKKKEREQLAEEQERYQQENRQGMAASRAEPFQPAPSPPQRPQPSEQTHRYQPRIPASPAPPDWRRPQPQVESEQIVLAEDITVTAARRLRQQQHLRTQAQRLQQAAELKAKARQDADAAKAKVSRGLHDGDISTVQPAPASIGTLSPVEIAVSPAQLRRAVVWAEILGPPRALREYSFTY
ncbi:MAG: hypothetical protein GWP14_03775 [Actinobacteria bacterium]|nr:hypothetical protein [Actinomycetota bacterium]